MNRIKYVDTLKFLAIFSIILLHFTQIYKDVGICNIYFNNVKEIFRFGVPLFLMITGMLMLNREIDLKLFFKKKVVRIVYPLIFFFLIALLLGIYKNLFLTYWYCWMIIGIYLAIPIINIFIKNAKENELDYLILLIIISSLIFSIVKIFNLKIALDLDFFIGPSSYLILGYYLSKKEFKISSPNKIALISLIIFILVTIYKIFNKDYLYFNNTEWVLSLLNLSFPQIIQTASLFIFIKYLYESSKGVFGKIRHVLEYKYINNLILSISRSSYGIYLFHLILLRGYIQPVFSKFSLTGTNTFILIILSSTGLLIVSWIVIVILSKIPIVKNFSGYG